MWQDHNLDDPEAPQQIDLEWSDDDGDDWVTCPGCGEEFGELAPRCPECGYWVIGEGGAEQRSLGWFWPIMVALLVAVIVLMWTGALF